MATREASGRTQHDDVTSHEVVVLGLIDRQDPATCNDYIELLDAATAVIALEGGGVGEGSGRVTAGQSGDQLTQPVT